jgi:AcrR family transcriptional regulator
VIPPEEIKKAKGHYHHGDLKAALIEAAAVILETRGLDALSLREAARRAGVSEAAPYRHFKDKAALLDAVTAQTAASLADEMRTSMAPFQGEGQPALNAGIKAVISFAVDQTARFRLLITPDAKPAFMRDLAMILKVDAGNIDHAHFVLAQALGLALMVINESISLSEAERALTPPQ